MSTENAEPKAPVDRLVHTAGPWVVSDEVPSRVDGMGGKHDTVAMCSRDDEGRARARFIAMAPAMMDQIDNAIDALDPDMFRHDIVELRERLIRFRSRVNKRVGEAV